MTENFQPSFACLESEGKYEAQEFHISGWLSKLGGSIKLIMHTYNKIKSLD
jgi:hypothetical protein